MPLESQHTEWKESWRDEYLRWVCGFANAQGGRLEIGRNDAGVVVGLADAPKLLEDLPNAFFRCGEIETLSAGSSTLAAPLAPRSPFSAARPTTSSSISPSHRSTSPSWPRPVNPAQPRSHQQLR
jgi:hypothetical protein